jgi:hypothetical protein
MTDEEQKSHQIEYWRGYYTACRTLSTWVGFTKPQREVIEEQGLMAKDKLHHLGVKFAVKRDG